MNRGDLVRITRSWSPISFTGIFLESRQYKVGKRYEVHKLLCTDGKVVDVYFDTNSCDSIQVLSEAEVQTTLNLR